MCCRLICKIALLHRNGSAAIYVEKARGGIREWHGLNFLADFCFAAGIHRWEVHDKKSEK